MSQDLSEVERWARENKMYMNMQKTKALLVTGKRLRKRMVQNTGKLGLKTDNAEIEQLTKCMSINSATNFRSDSAFYAILTPT